MNEHIVIYSHGFGVRKDSRGMFTDIAAALPTKSVLFDYNQFDEATNTLTVDSLSSQVEKLKQVIAETRAQHPDAVIDLICHSQGCIVAGLARPEGVRKIILAGPPAVLTKYHMSRIFGDRSGSHLDYDGISTFPRRDGSTTAIKKEYWPEIEHADPVALYNGLTEVASVVAIHATEDEILGQQDFSQLSPKIKRIHITAGHDFTDGARPKLVKAIHSQLERIPVVDEQDEIIQYRFRDEVTMTDIYRVSALWVKNSKGDVLLAQRGLHKSHDPGKWGPAAAGTVEQGETYEENAVKEAREELGLQNIKLGNGVKRRVTDPHNYFSVTFTLTIDKPAEDFTIEDDVAAVRWFTRNELARELREHPEKYLDLTWALENL